MNMKTKMFMKINGFSRLLLGVLVVLFLSPLLAVGQANCRGAESIEADTLCNMNTYELVGTEYWFKFEVSDTAFFQMGASELDVGIEAMYLYKGDCKNLVLVAMDTVLTGGILGIGDSLLIDEYYIRIVFADEKGEFEFCVYPEPDVEPCTANISRYYVPYNCQYEDVCFIGNVYISGPQPPPSFYEINWSFYGMHPDYTNTTYTTHDTICFQMDSTGTFMASICIVQWGEDIYGDTVFYQVCDTVSYEVEGVPLIDIDMSLNTGNNFLGCSNDTCYFDCSTTSILFVDSSMYIDHNAINPPLQWEVDTLGGVMGDMIYYDAGAKNPGYSFSWTWNVGPGIYQVYLSGYNDCGTDTIMKYLVIEDAYAFFIHDTVCEGSYTSFLDSSQCAYNWDWDFGDGGTDTLENPSHYYSSAGTYYVTLYINDSTYWYSDSVLVYENPNIPYAIGYFIDCDSLFWDSITQTSLNSYYVWSYDAVNWNDTVWTNPFVLDMPYGDTAIWIMAVDSITGCYSEPYNQDISPCCGDEYGNFWDNITITSNTYLEYDTLTVNGTVVIEDCEVGLGNMMVYFNPHAKIEVIGTGSLYLEYDSLMICPSMTHMWDGIYVLDDSAKVHGGSTYVRDAKNAIVVKNCGDYHLNHFDFDYNYRSLVVDTCNQCLLDSVHSVVRTDFRCSNTTEMLLPYYNTRGYSGVEVNNVDSVQIGNIPNNTHIPPSVYNHRNRFENLDYGIINVNSNLFVFNNEFVDLDQSNPNPPNAFIGVGIYSTASSEKNLVVGKNASSGCWSNTFENCWEGVYAVSNQNVSIVNDTIFNGIDYGFYIRNMDTKSLYIDSNVIDSVKYGVFVYNNRGFGVNKYISYNTITGCEYGVYVTSNDWVFSLRTWNNEIEGGYYPISFLNTRRANVQDNYIEFDYDSVPTGYTPMGIYAGNSRYATIMGNDVYYTGSSGWKPMGIYTDLCPSAHIECNSLYSQYDGIVCVGNMPSSTLKLNLMNGCTYGMYMNSATIGDQLSDSTQTDNRWVSTGTYKMSGGFNSLTNWWYTTNASSEYNPNPYSPSFLNINDLPLTALPGSCSGGAATSMGGGSVSSIISKDYVYTDNVAENEYYEDTYKYDLIKDNYSLISTSNNAITSYYNSLLNTNIDKFSQVKLLISNKQYANATTILNSINATNSIEKSMIDVCEIQIAQEKAGRLDFTNTEYNSLLNVSALSTLENGYGVFEACGMLGIHPYIELNVDPKTKSMMQDSKQESAFVYPNPATNTATVKYQFEEGQEGQGGELMLYSIEGKLVMKYILYANESERSINISNLDEGIYLYSIYSSRGNLVNQGKLVILR
jgi:Secretion system C-terminal sorting domain/PKD domain